MTPDQERDLLDRHGTTLVCLKPSNLIAAAEQDLRLRERKEKYLAWRKANPSAPESEYPGEPVSVRAPYLFLGRHVRRAGSVEELIRRALNEPQAGRGSAKRVTRVIYRDENILKQARAIASGQAA